MIDDPLQGDPLLDDVSRLLEITDSLEKRVRTLELELSRMKWQSKDSD